MTVCMLNTAAFLRNGRQIPLRHVEGLEMCNIIGLVGLITKVKLEDQRSETKAETRSCAKPIYLGKRSEIFRFSREWKVFSFYKNTRTTGNFCVPFGVESQ